MTYQRIRLQPISGSLGTIISGVDLREPLDDETYREIKRALLDNLLVFFRDQDITPEQQIAFGRRFGELHVHPFIPSLQGHKEIILLKARSGAEENLRLANAWHPDLSYTSDPPLLGILRSIRPPSRGGGGLPRGFATRSCHAAGDCLAFRARMALTFDRSILGREFDRTESDPVTAEQLVAFSRALGEATPCYIEPGESLIGHPTYCIRFRGNRFFPDTLPAGLQTRMSFDAGKDIEIGVAVRPGDVLTAVSTVHDIYEKTGRTGAMTFVVFRTAVTNERDETVAVIDQKMMFR